MIKAKAKAKAKLFVFVVDDVYGICAMRST